MSFAPYNPKTETLTQFLRRSEEFTNKLQADKYNLILAILNEILKLSTQTNLIHC